MLHDMDDIYGLLRLMDGIAKRAVWRYSRSTMAKISMVVPDEDLREIDEVAAPNRTAFMLDAAREAVARLRRQRLDAEIARCLQETADEDVAVLADFSGTNADGL